MAKLFSELLAEIPALTLSTKDFRWLHQSDWSEPEKVYFAHHRQKPITQLFKSPAYFKNTAKPHLESLTTWILNEANSLDTQKGWAEVQIMTGSFNKGLLLYDIQEHGLKAQDALSFIISATILLARVDTLKVIPAQNSTYQPNYGEVKDIYTFLGERLYLSQREVLTKVQVLEINPSAWWSSDEGRQGARGLQYLKTRIQRAEKKLGCSCKK